MAVSLGTVVAKAATAVASEAAKDPGKFAQSCIAICIGIGGGIALITTILCSTVSNFCGEELVTDSAITSQYESVQTAEGSISQYMAGLVSMAASVKEEIIEMRKKVTTYSFRDEKFTSFIDINNRSYQLREQYSNTENLISCNVNVSTTQKYAYTIEGKTPDGREFSEEKEYSTEEEVEDYISYRLQFGYTDITRTAAKTVYYTNFDVNVTTCDVQFIENWEPIPISYILAYQSTVTWGNGKVSKPSVSENLITDFLKNISPFSPDDQSEKEAKKVTFSNKTLGVEAIAALLWPTDEMKQSFFINSQQSYASMLTETKKVYVDFSFINVSLPIHEYYQTNYKDIPYGSGSIASAGCGPTCIAMMTTYFTGTVTTPAEVCRWCEADHYVPGKGTAWSVFPAAADKYGYGCINLGLDYTKVLEEVAKGNPVVVLVGPGTFTSGGHYMLIKGMTSSGELILNDPNYNNVSKYGTNKFKAETVLGEAKNFWVFYK